MAVSKAKELGLRKLAIPTAGNAGSAMAAYAAAAGLEAYVFAPDDTPPMIVQECMILGAHVYVIKGLINDAGRIVQEGQAEHGWFDMSTLKEPYRLEGKKTMGIELAEDFGWHLPDVILYPTGGGTGLIGMWKAFAELQALGWIDDHRPRMVVVQAEGCAPIVKAFEEGASEAPLWPNAQTMASGLRVPKAFADFLILQAVRDSEGTAVAVSDERHGAGTAPASRQRGRLRLSGGAATVAALQNLCQQGWIQAHERVVLFNTGSGLKYAELLHATPLLAVGPMGLRCSGLTKGSTMTQTVRVRFPPSPTGHLHIGGVRTALVQLAVRPPLRRRLRAAHGGYRSHTLD